MELVITIKMDNAAFGESDEERQQEVASILHKLAQNITPDNLCIGEVTSLFDSNGNRIGDFSVEEG